MKKFAFIFLIACLAIFVTAPTLAEKDDKGVYRPIQTKPEDMELVAVGTVREIVKSDQIKLSDGKIYVLDNIRIPVHAIESVREYLNTYLLNRKVGLFVNPKLQGKHTDNLGNMLVHVMTEDGGWVQADLILKGLAWAYSTQNSRDMILSLYRYEALARNNKYGMWRLAEHMVKNDKTIQTTIGSFQLYEGVVMVFRQKPENIAFMHFGKEPNKDFTVILEKEAIELFPRGYLDAMPGQRVLLRGWVEEDGGPAIRVTHPEQIQIVGPEAGFRAHR
jgi:hypothetical protein